MLSLANAFVVCSLVHVALTMDVDKELQSLKATLESQAKLLDKQQKRIEGIHERTTQLEGKVNQFVISFVISAMKWQALAIYVFISWMQPLKVLKDCMCTYLIRLYFVQYPLFVPFLSSCSSGNCSKRMYLFGT